MRIASPAKPAAATNVVANTATDPVTNEAPAVAFGATNGVHASVPRSISVSDIHCVTAWSRFDNRWRGVAVKDLLERVQPKAEARFVTLASYDAYTTNLPLAAFAVADALLATHWNGEPLSLDHGGPVRAIVPQLYFWKSAKWVKRIAFTATDQPGFWEERGYHNDGDPWTEQRYG